tara:strand:+ start:6402 stop:8339 length:1938 start_codon:yes stop_codon:yes gene_type:complete
MSHECGNAACSPDPSKNETPKNGFLSVEYIVPLVSLLFLLAGIAFDYYQVSFFDGPVPVVWFGLSYLLIGFPVLSRSMKLIIQGEIYNEFVLMSVATIGAFLIGSYAEGVAVMLFYVVGELVQERAVKKAKGSIEALLKVQVEEVTVVRDNKSMVMHPRDVIVGSTIAIKSGQRVALDGELLSDATELNTAALTGESMPERKNRGEVVYAGMINVGPPIQIKTTQLYENTKLSKILQLVQEAVGKKAKTQLLISRLAKVYTPIVFWLAIAVVAVPYLVLGEAYLFAEWFGRALIFLVISCPCALVISIPLGYFGGIGAGSRNGILFKGSHYLDVMTQVDTVVMDKTGTLTKGIFEVQQVLAVDGNTQFVLEMAAALEQHSTHPIAKAVVGHAKNSHVAHRTSNVAEIAGKGLKGQVGTHQVLAGNLQLLDSHKIAYDKELNNNHDTLVVVAVDGKYMGYIVVADTIKEDSYGAVKLLEKAGIRQIIMLSGDKQPVVDRVASQLGIRTAMGALLPADKLHAVEKLKGKGHIIAFVGDGINDAPVIALSDVGIAMGGLGSDAAIETADVVIQTDQPSKIATAIAIGRATKKIIWQNIGLAMGVKILVLLLGVMGMATMWEAVIADVGVALLAILNAVRIQRMQFRPV